MPSIFDQPPTPSLLGFDAWRGIPDYLSGYAPANQAFNQRQPQAPQAGLLSMPPQPQGGQPDAWRGIADYLANYAGLEQAFQGASAPQISPPGSPNPLTGRTLAPLPGPPAPAVPMPTDEQKEAARLAELQGYRTADLRAKLQANPEIWRGGEGLLGGQLGYFGGGADAFREGERSEGLLNQRALAEVAMTNPELQPTIQPIARDLQTAGAANFPQALSGFNPPSFGGGAPGPGNFGPLGKSVNSYADMALEAASFFASPFGKIATETGALKSLADAINGTPAAPNIGNDPGFIGEMSADAARALALSALLGIGKGSGFGGISFGNMSGDVSLGGDMGSDALGAPGFGAPGPGPGLGGLY